MFSSADKRKSNDMSQRTLDQFLQWLHSVDADARAYDHYDVVMNGDFLDLWQADRPGPDTMDERLADVLASNALFFENLGKYLRSKYPRCRFYYVIGNHDDALYDSSDGSHYRTRHSFKQRLQTETERVLVPGIGRVTQNRINSDPMSFAMARRYTNSAYQLLVEHGHQYDSFNRREGNAPAIGQSIAEFINHMQEADPAFSGIEFTPNQETVKHLACLKGNPNSPQRVRDLIDEMQNVAISMALSDSFWGAVADGLRYLVQGDRAVLKHKSVDPLKVRKSNEEAAKEIIDNSQGIQPTRIVVFGHTHFRDLQPRSAESDWAYANTGTWLDEIQAGRTASGCSLTTSPSPLPYAKISREKDANKVLVELKFYRGNLAHRVVRVTL
jgi:UDP-2,3-diacylglucosamine pyrophosphatase LpxH